MTYIEKNTSNMINSDKYANFMIKADIYTVYMLNTENASVVNININFIKYFYLFRKSKFYLVIIKKNIYSMFHLHKINIQHLNNKSVFHFWR